MNPLFTKTQVVGLYPSLFNNWRHQWWLQRRLIQIKILNLQYSFKSIQTFFAVSVNNNPLAKISQYNSIHIYCSFNFILMNYIERGLINLCKLVYRQIKQIKSENCFIKFDRCHKIKNSWKLTQMLMLKSETWTYIIATEEKCRQFNWLPYIEKTKMEHFT